MLMLSGFFIGVTGKAKWDEMSGVGRTYPLFAALFVLGALSLMGMPVFAGFWGKLTLLKSLFDGKSTLAVVGAGCILFSIIIEGIYFLRIGNSLFESGEGEKAQKPFQKAALKDAALTLLPVVILALLTLLFGLRPGLLSDLLKSAAAELSNTSEYIQKVLFTLSTAGGGLQ
jgi:formate hydrogenlyase subunit 3/multisubunit Na+/H+ antiporter MnhD subunit